MTLADIYLICFIVGFSISVLAVLGGMHHLHIPGLHGHDWHGHHIGMEGHGAPMLSLGNVAAFLTWFGGVGFLLSRFSGVWLWFAFLLAVTGGLIGGAIVFVISLKLLAHERPLNEADYEMVGVLGQLTSGIREGGIGEIGFSQMGVRRGAPARSDDGHAIPKGTEVLVTRYEKGIAFVRRWDELSDAKENE